MDFWVKAFVFILSISMSTRVVYLDDVTPKSSFHHEDQDHSEKSDSKMKHHRVSDDENHDRHHAVLFAATRSVKNGPPNQGGPIVFDQVQLNREGGYNNDTGIFTCPEEGIYFFAFSFLPEGSNNDTIVALVKNDTVHERLYSNLPPNATQLSERSCLLRLEEEDRVWVTLEEGSVLMHQASMSFFGYRISS